MNKKGTSSVFRQTKFFFELLELLQMDFFLSRVEFLRGLQIRFLILRYENQ